MKILVISNKPPYPPKDGGAIATFNLAKGMADQYHFVHILAMNTTKHHVQLSDLHTFNNLRFSLVEIDTRIKLLATILNFLFSSKPYNAQRFISDTFLEKLEPILATGDHNIVQLEGPYLGFCIPMIRRVSKAKIVLRAHNIEHEIWERTANYEKNKLKKKYLNNLAKRLKKYELNIFKQVDYILPITGRDMEQIKKIGIDKPGMVVPVGLDTTKYNYKTKANSNSIFYIGALDWIPNQEGLMWFIDNVWPLVLRHEPLAIFHVAGRNAPEWVVKKLALVKNLLYHGEIEDSQTFMQQFEIMVVPLFSGSGMRVKIIEGLVLGKIIVSSSIGAEGIEVTDWENIMIADNAETFASKICILLKDSDQKEKISKKAHDFVLQNYNNNVISKKLIDFYEEISSNN
jgi:polysaccharide biosynthesis protein PslH